MARMLGSDAILRSLEHEGVEVAFGIPGGAILPTYDAIARGTTVRHVLARHEQGAGHMAEGYARASGRVGVAIATSGPGANADTLPVTRSSKRVPTAISKSALFNAQFAYFEPCIPGGP